jgi:hypothetical protein
MLLKANRDPDTRPQPFVWVFWVVVFPVSDPGGFAAAVDRFTLHLSCLACRGWDPGRRRLAGLSHASCAPIRKHAPPRMAGLGSATRRAIVSGIAAVFYTLITPKPWTLLPLNALLHTAAAWALFEILRSITGDWKKALLGAAPFAFFPSSLTWTAQMHNDGYAIPGGNAVYQWLGQSCMPAVMEQ